MEILSGSLRIVDSAKQIDGVCKQVTFMDPERQPLLGHVSDVRCRRFRPLTREEVLIAGQDITWRRTRFFLILMFWALMAMFLSIITCILVTAPRCNMYDEGLPSVPPVHMSFAPLIRKLNNEEIYAM